MTVEEIDRLKELLLDGMVEAVTMREAGFDIDTATFANFLIDHGVTINEWIPVTERLPEDGEVVQIWCGEQQIARFSRGISMAERDAMKRGELEDPEEGGWALSTGYMTHKRSDVFKACDEWGNNTVPYIWESTCGPMRWFGQYVTHWKPKDKPPKGD